MRKKSFFIIGVAAVAMAFVQSRTEGATVTIMPIGDSITAGYNGTPVERRGSYREVLGQRLTTDGISFDFVGDFARGPGDNDHQGKGGASIDTMINEFGPSIANYQPDFALVLAGTNNHFDDLDDAGFERKYSDLLTLIRDHSPETFIIISTVPKFGYDRVPATSYWSDSFVDFRNTQTFPSMNRAIGTAASGFEDVAVVDFYSELDPLTDLQDDAVHPNDAGQAKLANLFYGALSSNISAIPEPSCVACFMIGTSIVMATRRRARKSDRSKISGQ